MDIAMGPLIWLGIVALFLVIEAATVGLTTIWFAGGALIAAIAAWIGAGEAVQWIFVYSCVFGAFDLYQTGCSTVYEQRCGKDQCGTADGTKSSCHSGNR